MFAAELAESPCPLIAGHSARQLRACFPLQVPGVLRATGCPRELMPALPQPGSAARTHGTGLVTIWSQTSSDSPGHSGIGRGCRSAKVQVTGRMAD